MASKEIPLVLAVEIEATWPTAIQLARVYGGHKRNIVGQHFWARRYFVTTVDRDERIIGM